MKSGYRIRVTGHSLGGGVAALLGALIRQHFEKRTQLRDSLSKLSKDNECYCESEDVFVNNDLIRVYSFGTPACVDERLATYLNSFVTSVVLHDDVVPRLTPTSIRRLIKHLLYIKETWVKVHLSDDISALANRASRAWAPRFRRNSENEESKELKTAEPLLNDKEENTGACTVDGDIFFEAEETLIESDDESDGVIFSYEDHQPEATSTSANSMYNNL